MTVEIEEGRIPVPPEWAERMGFQREAELTPMGRGFLVTPTGEGTGKTTWDEIFANKIPIGQHVPVEAEDEIELTGDDYFL
jgi:hypothetical protein